MARLYVGPEKWITGIVLQQLDPVSYSVEISNGRVVKRHVNQLRPFHDKPELPDTTILDTVSDNQSYPAVEPAPAVVPTPTDMDQRETERRYPLRDR